LTVSFAGTDGPCTVVGNSVHTTGTGTCTIRASQGGDANYNAAPDVERSFAIGKAAQTITFSPLGDKTFGDADFLLLATASSGLEVTFATASGPCTVLGISVHVTGAGSCTIRASQAGNANYNIAPDVEQSFTIAKANQTIAFGALVGKTFGDADFLVSATASSTLGVTFSVASGSCTISGSSVHIAGAGNCTVRASQAGNADYNAAPDVDRPFTIAKANQTVIVTTLAPVSAIYSTTFNTVATGGGSANAVAITTSGVCMVTSGGSGSATVQMSSGTGSCGVYYNQAGNANYNAAAQVVSATAAAKASQAITVTTSAPATAPFGSTFTVAATGGGSGNAVTFTTAAGDGCSNAGSTFTITSGINACQVIYNQAGNANYNPALQVAQIVTPIGYAFNGFFQPIDMSTPTTTVWNKATAGQAIPTKWQLTLNGAPVASASSFVGLYSTQVSCTTGAGDLEDAIEEYAPGASGLTYDGDGNFHFNWKTPTTYRNKCRAMYVSFSDGSTSQVASFKFK
jgi:hypothetical protein